MNACAACGGAFEPPAGNPGRLTCSRSCAVALSWKNPAVAGQRRASIKAQKNTPEGRAKSIETNHKRWAQPGQRERLSRWNRQRWADPETKAQLTAAIKTAHGTPEKRAFYSQLRTADWARPSYRERMVAAIRAHHGTPEARAKFSALLRGRWHDPVLRPKYLAAARANAAKAAGAPRGPRRRLVIHMPLAEIKVHRTRSEIMAEKRVLAGILKVLADAPQGMTSREILAAINSRFFGGSIPRTSFSPQLSRLDQNDHKVKQRGDKWILA